MGRRGSRFRPRIRARILALSKTSPPAESGLSHWSSREMAAFITRTEGVYVSHHYVAKLWRETGIEAAPTSGTFKVSKDPAFAEKVADVVGLYLEPPGGAVVLSIDEKTQIQALDRTQPVLPITFDATEKRTHDYVRHGTTNLFAALNVGNGQVYRRVQTHPQRRGLPGLLEARRSSRTPAPTCTSCWTTCPRTPHPRSRPGWSDNPHVHFHFTPVGSSWINQIETWFGIITRQSIRRGTFTSVTVLIKQIRDYIDHWNTDPKPFQWTATADEILAKVKLVQTNIKKLVDNNAK